MKNILPNKQKSWIAVYTKARHEKIVKEEFMNKGFETYLPLLRERRKWSDRKKWVEFPMFRSYVFVRIYLNEILPVLETPGVVRIISFGEKPAVINDKHISDIKLILNGGYKPQNTDYFMRGDKVIVNQGPLKGIHGEIVRMDNHDRLILRINEIQNSISVKIEKQFLKILV